MTSKESNARRICCPMCDKDKCDREADDCDVKQYLENKSKKYEDLKDNSDVYNMSVNELYETIAKSMRAIINKLSKIFDEEEKHYYRPPVEIKRDIKHKKNPMRIKQFNQELNESYKAYMKKGRKVERWRRMNEKKEYYSNCVLEAIKAKFKWGKQVRIIYIPAKKNDVYCPHMMWHDLANDTIKDFHAEHGYIEKWYNLFCFKGHIRCRPYSVYERWLKTNSWH